MFRIKLIIYKYSINKNCTLWRDNHENIKKNYKNLLCHTHSSITHNSILNLVFHAINIWLYIYIYIYIYKNKKNILSILLLYLFTCNT